MIWCWVGDQVGVDDVQRRRRRSSAGWAIWLEKNTGGWSDLQQLGGWFGLKQRGRTNRREEETKNADEQRNDLMKRRRMLTNRGTIWRRDEEQRKICTKMNATLGTQKNARKKWNSSLKKWKLSLKNSSSTWIFFHITSHHLQIES